jgi:beta-lactamase superfamily II metal-dependent hydrolase
MKFNIGAVSDLEILYAYDGVNTPVGGTDINDMSLIMKLSHANSTALLTGDLNNKIGEYLSKEGKELKADILKLPHHGTEGAAPDTFYDAVAPKVAMVPSPALLWCSARSARMKKWVETNKVSTYVNGFSGHVMVRFNLDGFKISEQKKLSASQRNNICK